MSCMTMAPRAIVRTNIAFRGLQFLSSLTALVLISTTFQETIFSPILGSRSGQFLMLMTYSSMMYTAWFLFCVELCPLATRPRILMMRIMDIISIVMLLTAAIVMFQSDFVSQCGKWNGIVRCKNLNASLFFSFVAIGLFGASIVLTFVKTAHETEADEITGYVIETTPTHAVFSPRPVINAPPTPSSKV